MTKRAPSKYILYVLQLYSSGLSLRKTSERLLPFIKRNHVSIWNWTQEYKPKKVLQKKRKKIGYFIVDETLIKISNQFVWVWIAIDSIDKIILGVHISIERTMLIAERFI
jgi:putative transposase